MAPKRRREAGSEEDAEAEQQAGPGPSSQAAQAQPASITAAAAAATTGARANMADIARRRAAHFANFKDDDEDDQGNVHVGSNDARTLGPWSSAVELVNAREQAAAEREDKIKAKGERDKAAAAEFAWVPSRDPSLGPHRTNPIAPLYDMCLGILTNYVDCIESLVGVPDAIKVRLASTVCAKRKMSPEVAKLFAAGFPTEVVLPDNTQLDAPALTELLATCVSPRMERLELQACGRGFGDDTARSVARAGPVTALDSLTLAGAYRLSEAGLEALVSATPNLTSLAVPDCSKLTGAFVSRLPALVPQLRHLNLAGCRGISAPCLVASLPQMVSLQSLSLDTLPEVDDAVVMAAARLPTLRELSIRTCQAVTDAGISALAAQRPELSALHADECHKVTDAGLTALAAGCKKLRVVSFRRCVKLSDEALASVLGAGAAQRVVLSGCSGAGPKCMRALAQACKESLEYLDISFCRNVPDVALGLVLDSCTHLQELHMFGCSQVTGRTLYGHSNEALRTIGMGTNVEVPASTA